MNIAEIIRGGGLMLIPIAILLAITVVIVLDRFFYLSKSTVDVDKLMSLLKSQIVSGNIRGAINTCEASPAPVTRIIAAGLRQAGGTEHQIQQAMDEEALRELPKVERRTGYLAMLGNLATLAGLLGTISGLIRSFAGVAGVDPSMKATALSRGISEAMNCTLVGLFTGIIGLATYAWLNGKTQGIIDGVNQATVETLNLAVAGRNEGGYQQSRPRRIRSSEGEIPMGVSVQSSGKGGRKSLNADLNLVPYIDLLTCMVAFLLITAVWTQLARLSAQQKGQGQAGEETPPELQVKIVVVVNQEGFNLVVGQDQTPIPKRGTDYDFEKLGVELKKAKDTHPDKNDVSVASEDQIVFDTLIKTMDTALTARFADISLVDTGAAGI